MYQMYQAQADLLAPVRSWANAMNGLLRTPLAEALAPFGMRQIAAGYWKCWAAPVSRTRPVIFGIDSIPIGEEAVAVSEEVADATPFATLLHFKKDVPAALPRVLVVAPMSGHFATLLRATVRTMLPEHDVFLTDWHNARDDVSVNDGAFGIDAYVEHVIRFLERIGPGAHVVAICQPCVPVLAAVAVMAEAGNAAQPLLPVLDADGGADRRADQSDDGQRARDQPRDRMVRTEPDFAGPVTLSGGGPPRLPRLPPTVSLREYMNLQRHLKAHWDLYTDLAAGEDAKPRGEISSFYDEYFAVADLPAEFYPRDREQEHLPRLRLGARCAGLARSPGKPGRDRTDRALDRRGRKRDVTSAPSGRRWPRTISAPASGHFVSATIFNPASGHYGGLQRQPLVAPDLPPRPQRHPGRRLTTR